MCDIPYSKKKPPLLTKEEGRIPKTDSRKALCIRGYPIVDVVVLPFEGLKNHEITMRASD
jgi:hypothetical protein